MSDNRKGLKRSFMKGRTLKALYTYVPACKLSCEQQEYLADLKTFLRRQPYSLFCTTFAWKNFVESTIKKGNVYMFMIRMERVAKKYPSTMYYLTNSGKIVTLE